MHNKNSTFSKWIFKTYWVFLPMIFFLLFSQNKALPFAMVKNFENFLNEKNRLLKFFIENFQSRNIWKRIFHCLNNSGSKPVTVFLLSVLRALPTKSKKSKPISVFWIQSSWISDLIPWIRFRPNLTPIL